MNQDDQVITNTYGYGIVEGVNFPALQSTTATLVCFALFPIHHH
jgi:hypothetical protein